ncbi:MAG: DNA mismatch repair endonuclease MutL [bacterium]
MDIIHLLPDSVANQIAAGEVIQRPSSVVKELVENAIDAGATLVKVIIKGAGRNSIQVIDNGKGMSTTDARMAFERHATSKIEAAVDLFALNTKGFRGEALASIAAIAQVELYTRLKGEELGTLIEISGSKVERQEVAQCTEGTNFIVKNLFYNVPARRKFLKSDETEMRNILQEIQRIALIHYDIAFQLYSNDDIIYDFKVGSYKQRIVALFGKKNRNISQQLIQIETNTSIVNIKGYVGTPQSAGKNVPQFFFVNDRFMFHPYFRRAVFTAFDRMIKPEDTPQFFIALEVDPKTIDVNIHPTKTEIKFENEREIWSIITIAIKEALGKFNIVPSIDFDIEDSIEIPVNNYSGGAKIDTEPAMPRVEFNPNYNPFQEQTKSTYKRDNSQSPRNWQELFEVSKSQSSIDFEEKSQGDICNNALGDRVLVNNIEGEDKIMLIDSDLDTIIHRGTHICLSLKSGLMLVDMQRAMNRIYYDDLLKMVKSNSGVSQKLLFPEIIEFSVDDVCLFTELEVELKAIGFEFSMFSKTMYRIEGVPAILPEGADISSIIDKLMYNIKEGDISKDMMQEIIVNSLSRSASCGGNLSLSADERRTLIGRLFASSNPSYTPCGEKIISLIDENSLHKMFSE